MVSAANAVADMDPRELKEMMDLRSAMAEIGYVLPGDATKKTIIRDLLVTFKAALTIKQNLENAKASDDPNRDLKDVGLADKEHAGVGMSLVQMGLRGRDGQELTEQQADEIVNKLFKRRPPGFGEKMQIQ